MKKRVLAAFLAAAMVVGLSACGSSTTSEKSEAEKVEDVSVAESNISEAKGEDYDIDNYEVENTTVKIYHRIDPSGGDAESRYHLRKIEEWNEQNNGITIETVFIPKESDYLDRLSTDIASGDAPDLFMQYGGTNCLDYVKEGVVLNLTPYLEADQTWYNGFASANWGSVDFGKYGYEGIYGTPTSSYEVLLYYNADYLKANNLEVPQSWDDLMNCCEVLKANGIQPFMVGESDAYRYGHLLSTLAVKTYGPEFQYRLAEREINYDSPEVVSLIQMIKDMTDKGYMGENILSVDCNAERAAFGAGECAFMYDLSRAGAILQDTECFKNQSAQATKFPYVDEKYKACSMGGANQNLFVCTMNKSDNQIKASLKVLKWLTTTEFYNDLVQEYPSTYSVVPSEEAIQKTNNYLYGEITELMKTTENYVQELAQVSKNTAELTIVRNALQMLGSGATAEDVAKEIVDNLANYE